MEKWLFGVLGVILFIIAIIFLLWIDWKLKCRKTVREYKLEFYAIGYAIFKEREDGLNLITIFDGVLGANSNELVFVNRFQDHVICLQKGITDIRSFHVSEYNENELLNFIQANCDSSDIKTKYFLRNMAGLSVSKRIPELIKKRMVCKIGFADKSNIYFCFKNTIKNVAAIEKLGRRCHQI